MMKSVCTFDGPVVIAICIDEPYVYVLIYIGNIPRVNRGNHVHDGPRSSGIVRTTYWHEPFFVCVLSIVCSTRMFLETLME
jgi:hypothetical protein